MESTDPAAKLSPSDLHVFAQCIWWVMTGDQLPDSEQARGLKWQDEAPEWVRMSAEILRHLDYNGFKVERST